MKLQMIKGMAMVAIVTLLFSCGGPADQKQTEGASSRALPAKSDDPMLNKGVGPVKNLVLGDLDPAMVAEGEQIFKQMCSACHKPEEKFIGPAPKGILARRSPEWIMNMILNPEEMVKYDAVAKQLLIEANLAPMANQNLTEEQARKILEYFRTLE